ncbi:MULTISPECIES: chorismate mutase [unclassified Sporosarcina]|uniref:chorismate mutase n=1 Tax=unclassified Sporosarcina TaxID=2647733 RepID=UPI000C16F9C2|nr:MULTISPECIES: chorismate mutase [unclassified Sporosarcina]PIC71970.1 chorismate mutase [Sporosarcina sp. P16b]PID02094.1 chorismate mutase [Sporosarcina sp. P2]PID25738.1 chorismate mutase [Sporosarcina sp. P7]
MSVRGIRGATTVENDDAFEVLRATESLVLEMAEANQFKPEDIGSVIVSTTVDVKAAFPAKAIRSIEGWTYVPVMCTHEIDVPGSMRKCIRVMMNVNTSKKQEEIQHIYQNNAVQLRPDLQK